MKMEHQKQKLNKLLQEKVDRLAMDKAKEAEKAMQVLDKEFVR